jgi:glycerol-3-phosphate dehydrogenase subunit C
MREGSLEAPVRHPVPWQDDDFYDETKLDAELRRVFDICHGCRRCFNLCDSFPRLFDLVDASPTEELDGVHSADFAGVADACTLCDLCFMTKCPYVPPHEWALDFPHLMLRYRAVTRQRDGGSRMAEQLTETDRNGKLASLAAPLVNWASDTNNSLTRPALEKLAGIDRRASLPKFHGATFTRRAARTTAPAAPDGPAQGRKALLYATCFVNYNNPAIGEAARAVLAHNGVTVEVSYPGCCGMPQLESGNIARVAEGARTIAAALEPFIDQGFDIIALVPSCALMLKFEWPLLLPDDAKVRKLAQASFDISEYIVGIARKEGLAPGLSPLEGGVTVHLACHARAQNFGPKAAELLRLIPDTSVGVVERCSGHGGAWGVRKDNFDTALKVGKPAAKAALQQKRKHLASECPLAGEHLRQSMVLQSPDEATPVSRHPVELLALAYGLIAGEPTA